MRPISLTRGIDEDIAMQLYLVSQVFVWCAVYCIGGRVWAVSVEMRSGCTMLPTRDYIDAPRRRSKIELVYEIPGDGTRWGQGAQL